MHPCGVSPASIEPSPTPVLAPQSALIDRGADAAASLLLPAHL